MAIDYTNTTGDMARLGLELSILRDARRMWEFCWRVTVGGTTYYRDKVSGAYINVGGSGLQAQNQDKAEESSKQSLIALMDNYSRAHQSKRDEFVSYWLEEYFGRRLLALDEGTISEGPVTYEYDERLLSETGQVKITRIGGILGALSRDMTQNSKTLKLPVVVMGAITGKSTNVGQLTENSVGGHFFGSLLAGTLRLLCVDETPGRTLFSVDHVLDDRLVDDTHTLSADHLATAGVDYEDGWVGCFLQPRYVAVVETGDNGNMISAFSVDKLSPDDTPDGKIFIKVTRQSVAGPTPPIFLIEAFSSADMTADDLIGSRGVNSISTTELISIPGVVSNITFTFDRAAANTHLPSVGNTDIDIVFDYKIPRLGDEFTKVITNDAAGLFVERLTRIPGFRIGLPAVGGGAETTLDSQASGIAVS